MKKSATFYSYLILILLAIGSIFVSCGGDNSGISPGINNSNPTSTPSPEMILKHVAGYVYATSSSVEKFIILDVPATGNDSFVLQMADYLQKNYPSEWNKSEIQEIYNQLSSEMSQWKTLAQYNSSAQFFTLYSDSPINVNSDGYFESDVPVQSNDNTAAFEVVLNDGEHFSVNRTSFADLLTSTGGNSGELKSCSRSVYALPGGISIFKVFASINLKESCLSFSLNDSSIGAITPPFYLKIKGQENFSIGYGVFKAKQESAAGMGKTGIINAKTSNGVNGQNIPMPVEIIHETVSISGKVFTDGSTLIDGHVKSIGPKSFCHLDTEGNYVLPEVFEGTNREVIATWWTDESGKRTKHVEIKYIDLLNGNLTDFNFGVPPTPTPTPTLTSTPTSQPLTDSFYRETAIIVMMQRDKWAEDLGIEQAVQKTVNWLNGVLGDPIPEGIAQAKVDNHDPTVMWIGFTDGTSRCIENYPLIVNNTLSSQNFNQKQINKETYNNLQGNATTFDSYKVKILAPFAWQNYHPRSVYDSIWNDLKTKEDFDKVSICKVTRRTDINKIFGSLVTVRFLDADSIDNISEGFLETWNRLPTEDQSNKLNEFKDKKREFKTIDSFTAEVYGLFNPDEISLIWEKMTKSTYRNMMCSKVNEENIIRPEDFLDLADYSIIYISTHGDKDGIACSPIYDGDSYLEDKGWKELNKQYNELTIGAYENGIWYCSIVKTIDEESPDPNIPCVIELYSLSKNFFDRTKNPKVINDNFSEALIYLNACSSFKFLELPDNPLNKAICYLGYSQEAASDWARDISYFFFLYMLQGYQTPTELFPGGDQISEPNPFPSPGAMSVQQAYDIFSKVKNQEGKAANPDPHVDYTGIASSAKDCKLELKNKSDNQLYFPMPPTITVTKHKK